MSRVVEKTHKERAMGKLAEDLLTWIDSENSDVAEFLRNTFNGGRIEPAMLEETIAFFTANSAITSCVLASPGSSIISELLYAQRKTTSVIDQYFYNSKGGMAVKGRLKAMQEHLPKIMERHLKSKGAVIAGSLGSGPGRYMIDAVSRLHAKGYNENVKAFCFDLDENAILRGKCNAVINGVSDVVRYKRSDMQGNIVGYYQNKFDVLVVKNPAVETAGRQTAKEDTLWQRPQGVLLNLNNYPPDRKPSYLK
ncbi:MAG: class I SAM-dependent methyltransferase family protein [Nitrospirae bacterium]|nr:class I SAM-dependent methyltransferase family protein [Nitrospirota bacterium]